MAHVPAPYDSQEGRQGPSLLVAGAQRPGGAASDPADGCAAGRTRRRGCVEARALATRLIGAPEQSPLSEDATGHLTVPVRLKEIRIERPCRFGDVYLALALWRGMGLEQLCEQLLPVGKERVAWASMAAVLVTARFCEPSSELHIAEDWTADRAMRSAAARRRAGEQGPAVPQPRSPACAQDRAGSASGTSLRRAVRGAERGAALRRDQHRSRRPGAAQSAGAARLFARSPAGLQAGLHRSCGDLRWLPAGLRGVRRQDARAHLADHRRNHGGAARRAGPGVDRRSRHGQRREPGMAARDRPALHRRRTQGGAEEVRRRTRRARRLARRAGRCRGQAHARSRHRRDGHPLPLAERRSKEQAMHDRFSQRIEAALDAWPGGSRGRRSRSIRPR